MKLKVFAIFDSKISAFNTPFFQRSSGEAIRNFSDAVNKEEGLSRHPDDYTLFELGSWDDSTGVFDMHDAPLSLGVAIQFVVKT